MTPRSYRGAAKSVSGGSSGDEPSRDDAAHPSPEAAAGKRALPDLKHSSRCAGGAQGEQGGNPQNAVHTCGRGRGESGGGNGGSRPERSEDGGRGEGKKTDDDTGKSGRGGDGDGGDPGGRYGGGKGGDGGEGGRGGEDGDSGDGTGNTRSGTQGMREEDVEEDEDGEEDVEQHGAEEEIDTFLRLSEVEFCGEIDVLQLGGTGAAARDSSAGGRRGGGGGGDESFRGIPRHLSDFFRSPLARDSTPPQRLSSIGSLSDVQTGARLFGSAKSPGSDDERAFGMRGSGNILGRAFRSEVGGAPVEVADSVVVNCAGSPASTAPAAGASAAIPDTVVDAGAAACPGEKTEHTQTAEIDELPVETSDRCEPAFTEVNDALCEPEGTEEVEEETSQQGRGHRAESVDDVGGGESEEEWLAGDEVESAPENSDSNARFPYLDATSTTSLQAESKVEKTVGTHWAGLNDDGSWRTEVARKAAGKAGEVEAERRRLAKIIADESWRSDTGELGGTGCRSRRDVRRDSVIRLQSGNVRYA